MLLLFLEGYKDIINSLTSVIGIIYENLLGDVLCVRS